MVWRKRITSLTHRVILNYRIKETALRSALLESVELLSMITCADVDQLQGQVVAVGNPGLFTGRNKDGRFIRKTLVDGNEYKLAETDSGAALPWSLLSVWANAGTENEFSSVCKPLPMNHLRLICCALVLMVKKVADTTKPEENPNGEDVNIGWHQIAKDWNRGKQVITKPVILDDKGISDR